MGIFERKAALLEVEHKDIGWGSPLQRAQFVAAAERLGGRPRGLENDIGQVAVPAYHVGGWYDIFLNGTLRNYMGLKGYGGTETARKGQRLMIGPWYHDSVSFREGKAGEVSFAPEGCRNEEDEMLRWFDYTLKGDANGMDQEKPVKIFVMGENVWREHEIQASTCIPAAEPIP